MKQEVKNTINALTLSIVKASLKYIFKYIRF